MNYKENKGFTLIELTLVVLIIGIIAHLTIPMYNDALDKSKYAQVIVQINRINTALETYYAENGAYPPDAPLNKVPEGLVPEYLDEWPSPENDHFGASYQYEAWFIDGSYWIGVVYLGKNRVRDSGLFGASYFVINGVDGIPQKFKDDIGIQVASKSKVVSTFSEARIVQPISLR